MLYKFKKLRDNLFDKIMLLYASLVMGISMYVIGVILFIEDMLYVVVVGLFVIGTLAFAWFFNLISYRAYFYHDKLVIVRYGLLKKEYLLNRIKKDVEVIRSGKQLYGFKFQYRTEEQGSKEEIKTFKISYVDRGLCEYLESIGFRIHGKEILYVKTNWLLVILIVIIYIGILFGLTYFI